MLDIFDNLTSHSQSRMTIVLYFVEEEKIPYFEFFVGCEVYLDLIIFDFSEGDSDLYLRFIRMYRLELKQIGKGNDNNYIVTDLYTYNRGILQFFAISSLTNKSDLLLIGANLILQYLLMLINNFSC
jgi:hypothetical protein